MIIVCVLVAFGMVLIWNSKANNSNYDNGFNDSILELESKIEKFLLNVDGIKNAKAIVTINAEYKATFDYYEDSEFIPNISGIAIACTNGDNYDMKIKITKLISAYLGIPYNRIEIVSFG